MEPSARASAPNKSAVQSVNAIDGSIPIITQEDFPGNTQTQPNESDSAHTGSARGDVSLRRTQKNAPTGEAGSYTRQEANAIRCEGRTFRNLVAGIDTTISRFFDRWKAGRKNQNGEKLEKLYIGKMSDSVGRKVSAILGYDVAERNFIITNDDVKHIMDQHGDAEAEIRKGNLPLENWVFECLPEVLSQPDRITPGHMGGGKKNAGKIGIVFSKSFPRGRVVSIQFDNKGRGTLEVTTLYVKKGTTPSEMDAGGPAPIGTSETPEPVVPSIIIAQKSSKIKKTGGEDNVLRRSAALGVPEQDAAMGVKEAPLTVGKRMTEAERAELEALHAREDSLTQEEEARYRELLSRLIEEVLYWGGTES